MKAFILEISFRGALLIAHHDPTLADHFTKAGTAQSAFSEGKGLFDNMVVLRAQVEPSNFASKMV